MDSILVTGASGFLGGYIARGLLEKGYKLRLQYRRSSPPSLLTMLREKGAELIRLDLTSPGAAEEAVAGVDGVVHTAALIADWGSRKLFTRINAELPKKLAHAAREKGCRRFIYISSIAVHGFGFHRGTSEEGPYYTPISSYQKTKLQAEQYILDAHSEAMETAIIRPGNIYGPGDTTTFYPIFDAMMKGIMGYTGRGDRLTCPVYVEDVVQAVVKAYEEEGSGGEIFNITGGEEVTWKDILEHAACLLGVKPPVLRLPVFPARLLALLLESVYFVLRIKSAPPITRYRVDTVSNDYHFDIGKAKEVLGFTPETDWRTGFQRTVEAYLKTRETGGPSTQRAPR